MLYIITTLKIFPKSKHRLALHDHRQPVLKGQWHLSHVKVGPVDLCLCPRSQVLNEGFTAMSSEDHQARPGCGGAVAPSEPVVLGGQAPLC